MCPNVPYSFRIWYRTVAMMSFRIAFAGEDWVDRVLPSWTAVPIADGKWHGYYIHAITMSEAELDRYPNLVVVYEGIGQLALDDGSIAPSAGSHWMAERPRSRVTD